MALASPEVIESLAALREEIEKSLSELLPENLSAANALLYQAARYSLLSPAKRLRPLLVLATVGALEKDHEDALYPAAALEMVHTYSLIHDDLPCMDDDDLRRGRPTLHKVYPEGQAVLAGDFLLTYAFELLAKAPRLSDSQKVALIASLSQGAGGEGMIGGQVIDLQLTETTPSWELLSEMHLKKTAALIATALDMGAIVAEADPKVRATLSKAGEHLGLAFQIIDDILDVTGNEASLGKPVGSDARNAKATAVTLLGLPKAQSLAKTLLASAERLLQTLPNPPLLLALSRKFVERIS